MVKVKVGPPRGNSRETGVLRPAIVNQSRRRTVEPGKYIRCSDCSARFAFRTSLRFHRRRKHRESTRSESSNGEAPSHRGRPSGRGDGRLSLFEREPTLNARLFSQHSLFLFLVQSFFKKQRAKDVKRLLTAEEVLACFPANSRLAPLIANEGLLSEFGSFTAPMIEDLLLKVSPNCDAEDFFAAVLVDWAAKFSEARFKILSRIVEHFAARIETTEELQSESGASIAQSFDLSSIKEAKAECREMTPSIVAKVFEHLRAVAEVYQL